MRKILIVCCLLAFGIGTMVGCSEGPSTEKGKQTAPPSVTAEQ